MMSTLVVHPAYGRKGHATELIKWSTQLCDLNHFSQGVSAADMAIKLYKKLGYGKRATTQIGNDDDPGKVWSELLVYPPKSVTA